MAGQSFVQLATDGTGKKMDTQVTSTAAQHRQVMTIGDPATDANVAAVNSNGLKVDAQILDAAPATQAVTAQDSGSSTSTALANSQSVRTGTPTAGSVAAFSLASWETAIVQVTGTWTGTLLVEGSFDGGTTYYQKAVKQIGTSYIANNFTGNFAGTVNVAALTQLAVRSTAAWTGTATVRVVPSKSDNGIYVHNGVNVQDAVIATNKLTVKSPSTAAAAADPSVVTAFSPNSPLPAGTAVVGKVTTDQTTHGTTDLVAADVTKISGTAADVNSGNKSAGTLRVVIATDQPALTNKLLVTPDLPSGASTAAKQPALGTAGTPSADVLTVQGRASMTPLLVDASATTQPVSGTVTVAQATATSLKAQAENYVGGTAVSASNPMPTAGTAAHGATVAGNPVLSGGEARKTLGTAVTDGQAVRRMLDAYGMTVVVGWPTSHASSNGTPITSTATSVLTAPGAGTHNRILRFHMSNGGATATWVALRDGASGTQHYRTYLVQGSTVSLNLNLSGPLDQTSNTRLDIVLSAAGSVEYEIDYLAVTD